MLSKKKNTKYFLEFCRIFGVYLEFAGVVLHKNIQKIVMLKLAGQTLHTTVHRRPII